MKQINQQELEQLQKQLSEEIEKEIERLDRGQKIDANKLRDLEIRSDMIQEQIIRLMINNQ